VVEPAGLKALLGPDLGEIRRRANYIISALSLESCMRHCDILIDLFQILLIRKLRRMPHAANGPLTHAHTLRVLTLSHCPALLTALSAFLLSPLGSQTQNSFSCAAMSLLYLRMPSLLSISSTSTSTRLATAIRYSRLFIASPMERPRYCSYDIYYHTYRFRVRFRPRGV